MGVWLLLVALICVSACLLVRRRRARRRAARMAMVAGEDGRMVRAVTSTPPSPVPPLTTAGASHPCIARQGLADVIRRDSHRQATERATVDALNSLPTSTFSDLAQRGLIKPSGPDTSCGGGGGGGGVSRTPRATDPPPTGGARPAGQSELLEITANECCLCMEHLGGDDVLRVLPCRHFFHRDCIDRWFATKPHQQRTCPLCKRDPLEQIEQAVASAAAASAAADSRGRAAGGAEPAPAAGGQQAAAAVAEEGEADVENSSEASGVELVELPESPAPRGRGRGEERYHPRQ